MEIIVVLCTMGLVVGLALPMIGFRDPLKEASRQIAGTIGLLRDAAIFSRETQRLYFDMDQQMYWATVRSPGGERLHSHPELANGISLISPVRIGAMTSPRSGKTAVGRSFLELHPDGHVDPAVILLFDEDGHVLSLKVDRFSGYVGISADGIEFKPRPIPSSLLSLLRPLPPVSRTPRM